MLFDHLYSKAKFYLFLCVPWGIFAKEKSSLLLIKLLARGMLIYSQKMLQVVALF